MKFAGVPTFKNNRRFERKFAPRVILPRCGRKKFLFFTSLNSWNTFCGFKTSKIKFSRHTFFL
ncbi:hypothetical protein B1J93_10700 [Leptospira kirschneri serovar Pomona]|uniref:Uncharacterized protein n=1 Tax=Leptospira kirschneri serovar Pomona TaxID=561005 RepID=A0A1T1DMP2_9LEPT|nr:hypothetical protein B1J93_10700 [Leptospira kirschneri serovar Pomona]